MAANRSVAPAFLSDLLQAVTGRHRRETGDAERHKP
jgi:hypothetical protein